MNEILKKLKTDFEFLTGYLYRGLVQAIGAGYASRLSEFVDKLSYITKQMFVVTADKDYLYLHMSKILPPLSAETATGLVVFYGTNGAIIPADKELKDDDAVFKTIGAVTIATTTLNGTADVTGDIAQVAVANQLTNTEALVNGVTQQITIIDSNTIQFEAGIIVQDDAVEIVVSNAIVSVKAQDAGVAGNKVLNDVLKLKTTIDGVNNELGILAISGGLDDESVEDYRQRCIDYNANPQSPFSKPHIQHIVKLQNSSLKYVWVKGGELVEGAVKVFAVNESFGLTADEQAGIIASTKSIAPAQMDTTAITSTLPIISNVDVEIASLLPTSDGLKAEVDKNIKYLFDTDLFEKGISASKIEATIFKTTNGKEEVISFTLVTGEVLPTTNTFWKLANVIHS